MWHSRHKERHLSLLVTTCLAQNVLVYGLRCSVTVHNEPNAGWTLYFLPWNATRLKKEGGEGTYWEWQDAHRCWQMWNNESLGDCEQWLVNAHMTSKPKFDLEMRLAFLILKQKHITGRSKCWYNHVQYTVVGYSIHAQSWLSSNDWFVLGPLLRLQQSLRNSRLSYQDVGTHSHGERNMWQNINQKSCGLTFSFYWQGDYDICFSFFFLWQSKQAICSIFFSSAQWSIHCQGVTQSRNILGRQ